MKLIRLIVVLLALFAPVLAYGQSARFDGITFSPSGRPLSANIAVCSSPGLATTAAQVIGNTAILTMASNPITAGFAANQQIVVSGFTGGDTYFNSGVIQPFTSTVTITNVSATTITFPLTHANASAATNGSVLQMGNISVGCAPLTSIYTDAALANLITQPGFVSSGVGNFGFYVHSGNYVIQYYGPGVTTYLQPLVLASPTGVVTSGVGPPVGSCAATQIYVNSSNGQIYSCTGGSWFLAGGGSIANPVAALPVGVDTGITNAYVITTVPSFSPAIGSSFVAQLSHANTGAPTMNVNGFGVKNLIPASTPTAGHPFTGGEFNTTTQYLFTYDGVQWLGRNCFPGFPCGSGNGADYTQQINIPPDGQINLTTRALDNADQSRSLLNFYCPTKNTGCFNGQQMHFGFDGDGVFTIGAANSGAVVGSLIGTTWEYFDSVGFAGNGQANQAYLVQIVPNPAQTSGNTFHVVNPDASNIFTIDATSHITVGANNCTNASPAVCGKNNSGAVAVAAGSTTLQVNTSIVTANSQILLTEDSSLGTKLGVTCNATPTVQPLTVTARTPGTSFTFSNTSPSVNPRCVSYWVIN